MMMKKKRKRKTKKRKLKRSTRTKKKKKKRRKRRRLRKLLTSGNYSTNKNPYGQENPAILPRKNILLSTRQLPMIGKTIWQSNTFL